MLKVVIVDDCEEYSDEINNIVKKYYEKKKMPVLTKIYNKSLLLLFDLNENTKYDIYFLDIEMPETNGLQLASEIRKVDKNALIIFVTSHLKYSIVGYELGIYRYIPKNDIKNKLVPALESASDELRKTMKQIYLVSTSTKYEKIRHEEIIYIYKDRKYSVLVCTNNSYKVRKSLGQVYEELNNIEAKQFIFIERGYIVNIIHINRIINGEVIMQNGEVFRMGRSHIATAKLEIAKYWSN